MTLMKEIPILALSTHPALISLQIPCFAQAFRSTEEEPSRSELCTKFGLSTEAQYWGKKACKGQNKHEERIGKNQNQRPPPRTSPFENPFLRSREGNPATNPMNLPQCIQSHLRILQAFRP